MDFKIALSHFRILSKFEDETHLLKPKILGKMLLSIETQIFSQVVWVEKVGPAIQHKPIQVEIKLDDVKMI